ncbi:hypothetical protein [Paenibacillus xylaniclasticus]|uniref:hypothetical protein n=1 Tax=Paenibacillus xylaniclasticus TaxID=588083 RepID=UPI000FDBF066|nr:MULTISPECIES: hypothetical protein [Paenibacillus]GFN30277.1 hypothetical protein PCURB6_05370 [Paenibacillus curdlanolyticus]
MRSDRSIGLGLLSLGAGLTVLGGLERIILYVSKPNYVGNEMDLFRQSVPDAIWSITTFTMWSGLPFILAGLYIMLRRSFAKIAAELKAANDRFESEYNRSNHTDS